MPHHVSRDWSSPRVLINLVALPFLLGLNYLLSFALMMLTRILVERTTQPEPHQPTVWVWFGLNLLWLIPLLWGAAKEGAEKSAAEDHGEDAGEGGRDPARVGSAPRQASGSEPGPVRLVLDTPTALRLEHLPPGGTRLSQHLDLDDLSAEDTAWVETLTGGRTGTRFRVPPDTVTEWLSHGQGPLAETARELADPLPQVEEPTGTELEEPTDSGVEEPTDSGVEEPTGSDAAGPPVDRPVGQWQLVGRVVYALVGVAAVLCIVGLVVIRILIDSGRLPESATEDLPFTLSLVGFLVSLPAVWWLAALPMLGRWWDAREDPPARRAAARSLRLFLTASCWVMVFLLILGAMGFWLTPALAGFLPVTLAAAAGFALLGWLAGRRRG